MIRLYSAPDLIALQPARDLLDAAGIPYLVRNEFLSGALGELPAQEIWPQIWVAEADIDRARTALQPLKSAPARDKGSPWTCPRCGEENDASFEICWQCGQPRDERRQD
ncbi:putative signal transducing protein [Thiohalobacter sp.]|uniref:putative signal transducing protein n=1 Tax=Thiohalobacter sp. TaxID=2025948 RepID=UPI002601697D|nr:DUF2007 domain-containing protein [Thiohalobacter sp.]